MALSLLFLKPLIALARLALADPLYGHLPLIPLVSIYLIWIKRDTVRSFSDSVARTRFIASVLAPLILGVTALAGWFVVGPEWKAASANSASLLMLSYVCFVWTIVMAVFGWEVIRRILFPVTFLVFVVPFPTALTHQVEIFFQHASADAASLMFAISQTSLLRDGLFFKLPGITLEVAQECSGIRSTLVLFITSLVGGYMFFKFPRHRAVLAVAVIPLAIIRNGFRIFTIAMLCVHVDPDMIHSVIHRRGGPLFFALSLIPFFALLLVLCRREKKMLVKSSGELSGRPQAKAALHSRELGRGYGL